MDKSIISTQEPEGAKEMAERVWEEVLVHEASSPGAAGGSPHRRPSENCSSSSHLSSSPDRKRLRLNQPLFPASTSKHKTPRGKLFQTFQTGSEAQAAHFWELMLMLGANANAGCFYSSSSTFVRSRTRDDGETLNCC